MVVDWLVGLSYEYPYVTAVLFVAMYPVVGWLMLQNQYTALILWFIIKFYQYLLLIAFTIGLLILPLVMLPWILVAPWIAIGVMAIMGAVSWKGISAIWSTV